MSDDVDDLRAMMDGRCLRCSGYSGDRELWDPLCPRCQQLAALEAEIGRAVIGAGVIFNATNPEIDGMIARWRELHAEGAPE